MCGIMMLMMRKLLNESEREQNEAMARLAGLLMSHGHHEELTDSPGGHDDEP